MYEEEMPNKFSSWCFSWYLNVTVNMNNFGLLFFFFLKMALGQ